MDLDEGVHHVYDWLMGGRDEDPSIRAGSCRSRFFHQLDAGLGMEIVLSGLDEEACRNVVGDALWSRDSSWWLAPARFRSERGMVGKEGARTGSFRCTAF